MPEESKVVAASSREANPLRSEDPGASATTSALSEPDSRQEAAEPSDDQAREQLIGAAISCFGAGGYDATTIWQVASDAGVDARTLYRCFGSKKALFTAAYDRAYAEFFAHLLDALNGQLSVPDEGAAEWMGRIIDALTGFMTSDRDRGRFIALAPIDMARSPDLSEIVYNDPQERMHQVVTGMVDRLQATGRLHPDASPTTVAYLVLAILHGAGVMLNVFGLGDPSEMADALKLFAAGSLFGG